MTQEEFKEKFPIGSIISYIGGMQYVRAKAREIFKIERYLYKGEHLYMAGTFVGFDFQSTRYKKEYTTEDANKWHYIDCNDDAMARSIGCLTYNFNDVRLANDRELEIFKYVLDNDLTTRY